MSISRNYHSIKQNNLAEIGCDGYTHSLDNKNKHPLFLIDTSLKAQLNKLQLATQLPLPITIEMEVT